jgi:uncharacterized membrane protein YkoI
MKTILTAILASAAFLTAAPAMAAATQHQPAHTAAPAKATKTAANSTKTAAKPRVSMAVARAKALAQVRGGRVQSAELETEKGQLIYSFDIKKPRNAGIEEVHVSAITGKVVERRAESASKERMEQRTEAHHKAT